MTTTIHVGDALEVLRTLPAESVHCVVTSPPYWGLRNYDVPGQLGLEPTPEEHVARMVEVFREVRRVLRNDGTLWLNYGDSYCTTAPGTKMAGNSATSTLIRNRRLDLQDAERAKNRRPMTPYGLKPKDLVGMPWRIAFALQADGWYLRSEIIWHKPNPMPESVTDRPTKSHEQIFLLARSPKYFYDADAVREDGTRYAWTAPQFKCGDVTRSHGNENGGGGSPIDSTAGRNLRSVWTIATHPFPGAHFATFPPALVEPCVKAGTSERGCCATCGKPLERVVELAPGLPRERNETRNVPPGEGSDGRNNISGARLVAWRAANPHKDLGFRPTCAHGGDPVPCTVLDPFFGAGTVGLVADRLGRNCVGIELNPEYARMAEKRIKGDCPLFAQVTRA